MHNRCDHLSPSMPAVDLPNLRSDVSARDGILLCVHVHRIFCKYLNRCNHVIHVQLYANLDDFGDKVFGRLVRLTVQRLGYIFAFVFEFCDLLLYLCPSTSTLPLLVRFAVCRQGKQKVAESADCEIVSLGISLQIEMKS